MEDHWFDQLNKALMRDKPRRTLLGAAVSAISSLVHGDVPIAEAAKQRKKGKRKKKDRKKDKKDKPKSPPDPSQTCSGGACAAVPEWAGNDSEIEYCEDKCERCTLAEAAFCIHKPHDPHPDIHATCCPVGEECCDGECCLADRCCDRGAGRGKTCIGRTDTCCPDDFESGVCRLQIQQCCDGFGCVDIADECPDEEDVCTFPRFECGPDRCCDPRFPACQACRDRVCVSIQSEEAARCASFGMVLVPGQCIGCCVPPGGCCTSGCGTNGVCCSGLPGTSGCDIQTGLCT